MWGHDERHRHLAIIGGMPHRGRLLEPVTPHDVLADIDAYVRVLEQLSRGIEMVTGRPVVPSSAPGWIGVRCDSDGMATWIMRAIVAENIVARREGRDVFLPAGPRYEIDGAIADVVAVCARTFHFWGDNIAAVEHHHDDEARLG
jgi:sirohydrochlorin cobaltochelatase